MKEKYCFKIFRSPKPLERFWRRLESSSDCAFCQTYDWQLSSFAKQRTKRVANMLLGKTVRFFTWLRHDEPLVAGAVEIKKVGGIGCARVLQPSTYSDILDFLYAPSLSKNEMHAFIDDLMKALKISKLVFPFVRHGSPSLVLAGEGTDVESLPVDYCPTIRQQDPEKWKNGLSANTKQNLRTKKNRLLNDKRTWSISTLSGASATKLIRRTQSIKLRRWHEKKPQNAKGPLVFLKTIAAWFFHFSKYDNVIPYYLRRYPAKAFLYALFIDQHPVAITVCCDSSLSYESQMLELYFDSRFSRYSPGMLLMESVIEKQLAHNKAFNFLLGGETYKLRLGGQKDELYKATVVLRR